MLHLFIQGVRKVSALHNRVGETIGFAIVKKTIEIYVAYFRNRDAL